jgi:peptidoglycan/xylan/chitin deacetylase (PgdA/CDA1 family)
MPSEVMDCFTAFAMTATFAMTGLFMESPQIRADTAHGLPRHYVPRNDGVICVIARPQAVAIHAFGSHGLLHCSLS